MQKIIYTGTMDYLYKLARILLNHRLNLMQPTVDRGEGCSKPIIVINTASKTAWIEYVSEDISEYDNEEVIYTCSPEEVDEAINNMKL